MIQTSEKWPDLWIPAYIGLGSNLGDPPLQIEKAFTALAALPQTRSLSRSGIFQSSPMGPIQQPDFLNAAAGLLTQLAPQALLDALKNLERALGRASPVERWGPRVIDLDLLVYGALRLQEPQLTLPHPGIHERNFVLLPLLDIAPGLEIPGKGRVRRLAEGISRTGIRRLTDAASADDDPPQP
jgi:2-amino-4-hydroxy-6-hydroxymethyldihydropteridine diphosphokinase